MPELKTLLNTAKRLAQPYFTHASGQALAWYTVATHDLSKWEAGVAVAGTAALTTLLAKISAWLATPASKS